MATWLHNNILGFPTSLNAFRITGDFRYNRERHEQVSPEQLEAVVSGYNEALGIPLANAFETRIHAYLESQDNALGDYLKDNAISPDNFDQTTRNTWEEVAHVEELLLNELKDFTKKIAKLPASTHPEALTATLKEERDLLLNTLKSLNKKRNTLKAELKQTYGTPATTTAATTTPFTDSTTSSSEQPEITATGAQSLSNALNAMEDELSQEETDSFKTLETDLTNTITDIDRAAQLERDRIALFAVLEGNKRKLSLFQSTIAGIKDVGRLFSGKSTTSDGVLMTGDNQQGVRALCDAMRRQDLSGQQANELKEHQEKLATAESRLKKANEKNDEDQIQKYTDEIKAHQEAITAIQDSLAHQKQNAADMINARNTGWLIGYDPGLTSLSGQSIKVSANNQGLGFALDFPRPIFSPGYYTSARHNTKADLVCLAELVRTTGATSIETTVECSNEKRALKLAREAYEAALEVGFPEDKITIIMNGRPMSSEDLYKHLNREGKEDNKYAAHKQRAQSFKQLADQSRATVEQHKQPTIEKQTTSLRAALHTQREALKTATQQLASDSEPTISAG